MSKRDQTGPNRRAGPGQAVLPTVECAVKSYNELQLVSLELHQRHLVVDHNVALDKVRALDAEALSFQRAARSVHGEKDEKALPRMAAARSPQRCFGRQEVSFPSLLTSNSSRRLYLRRTPSSSRVMARGSDMMDAQPEKERKSGVGWGRPRVADGRLAGQWPKKFKMIAPP